MKIKLSNTSLSFLKHVLSVIMRSFILFFCTTVFSFSTENLLSQKIIIEADKTVTAEDVLDMIDRQTEYSFVYEVDLFINLPVIQLKKGTIMVNELLKRSFPADNFDVIINENDTIFIKGKQMKKLSLTQKSISGSVIDVNDQPLPGANILVKGTTSGTQTDFNGNFSLQVANENVVLIVSYLGFLTKEVAISGENSITVTLQQDSAKLDEAVITALGIKREEKSLGYSVSEVSGTAIRESSEVNLINALSGKVAGVRINASAGGADASSRIIIRGENSLRGNNQPLFVIDGVQIDNNPVSLNNTDSGRDFGNNISDINPDDIESMSVLKGPNAAALYGSRAANGVVIITTKKGKRTKGLGLTYSSTILQEQAYEILPLQNQYGSGEGPRFTDGFFGTSSNGVPTLGVAWNNFGPSLDGTTVIGFNGQPRSYSPQPNNIIDFYMTGYSHINNIAFSGANEDVSSTYRVSFTNRKKRGIIERNESDKYSFNFRGTQKITNYLNADVSVSYNKSEGQGRPVIGNSRLLNRYVGFFPRDLPIMIYRDNYKQENGSSTGACPWCFTNSYWEILEKENIDKSDRLIATIDLNFSIADWLNLKLKTSTDGLERYFENSSSGSQAGGTGTDASFSTNQQINRQFTYEFLLSASKELTQELDLSLSVGGQSWDSKFRSVSASTRNGLRTPRFFAISNSNLDPIGNSSFRNRRINSLYGFGQLAYKNYLFLDFTARNDWSSTLPLNNNSYFYPSSSLSFVFTDTFNIGNSILSFGKLRASWAQVGNDAQQAYLLNSVYNSTGTFGNIPLASTTTTVPPGKFVARRNKFNRIRF